MKKRKLHDNDIYIDHINNEEEDDFAFFKKHPHIKRHVVAVSLGVVVFYYILVSFIVPLFQVKQGVEEIKDTSVEQIQYGNIEYKTGAFEDLLEHEIALLRTNECSYKILELKDKTFAPKQTLKYNDYLFNSIPFNEIKTQNSETPEALYHMILESKPNLKLMYPNFYKITSYYHNDGAYIQIDFDEDGKDYRKFYMGTRPIAKTENDTGMDTAIINYEYSITSAYENFHTDTVLKDVQSIFGDIDDEEMFIATIPSIISSINDIENNVLEAAASFMTSSGATITIYGKANEETNELTISIIGVYMEPCETTTNSN